MKISLCIGNSVCALALVIMMTFGVPAARAVTTNYYTGFETADGFTNGYAVWDNSSPWIGVVSSINTNDYAGYAGNGIVADHFPGMGQQAFVGQTSLGYDTYGAPWVLLDLWPTGVDFDPVATGRPIVKFTTKMAVEDSTYASYDDFYWEAYNTNGARLFTLDFYNGDNHIYYILGGGSSFIDTGKTFTNGAVYNLLITMDFASNVWTATLNGASLVGPLPLAAAGVGRTFGEMDAIWDYYYSVYGGVGYPGDNYMVFDNYLITSEAATLPLPSQPGLIVLSAAPAGSANLRLTGQEGYKFAILASTTLQPGSWTPLSTNTVSGGYFDYTDTGASSLNARYYRAIWVP